MLLLGKVSGMRGGVDWAARVLSVLGYEHGLLVRVGFAAGV